MDRLSRREYLKNGGETYIENEETQTGSLPKYQIDSGA